MIAYFIPLIFLTILTLIESSKRFDYLIKNKYLYSFLALFFIIFIGLRYEIGCDWPQYKEMFEKYNSLSFLEMIERNFFSEVKLQEIGHIFLTLISQNIYILNLIYSVIFSLPLFYFCSQQKRTYFTLLTSYPYYIVVVGMGPIRQAACISILMLSILLVSKRKYYSHFFFTIISSLLHTSSILLNGLILGSYINRIKRFKLSKISIFFMVIFSLAFLYCLPSIVSKVYFYITYYKYVTANGIRLISPAKGAIYIWFINFIPSIIFLTNIYKFKFENSLNKILILLTLFEISLLPLIFLNSVIAYRLLLYLFPSSILITSQIPELNLLKVNNNYMTTIIIVSSFISLIIWLKFAYHSSCWVPYKHIIFN